MSKQCTSQLVKSSVSRLDQIGIELIKLHLLLSLQGLPLA